MSMHDKPPTRRNSGFRPGAGCTWVLLCAGLVIVCAVTTLVADSPRTILEICGGATVIWITMFFLLNRKRRPRDTSPVE